LAKTRPNIKEKDVDEWRGAYRDCRNNANRSGRRQEMRGFTD
jgi:hypothetical protein